MSSVEVVTVCSRIPDRSREPYYNFPAFLKSLERFGVKPTVLGLGEPWGGLMTKPRRLRGWLRAGGCTAETLVVCDSFDIVWTASPDEVGDVCRKYWPGLPIVFNAERAIFPRGELKHLFDERAATLIDGASHWRYLNSGFFIGPPARILEMLEAMWLDDIHDDVKATDALHGGSGTMVNTNDQGHYQYAYCAQVVPMHLDYSAQICQTLSGCSLDEFDLSGERLKNIATGSYPLVWHFNGGSKDILMPAFLRKWGLDV